MEKFMALQPWRTGTIQGKKMKQVIPGRLLFKYPLVLQFDFMPGQLVPLYLKVQG